MNGLFLCGYGCKPWIWEDIKKALQEHGHHIQLVEWPKDLITQFHDLTDYANWVNAHYEVSQFDYIPEFLKII